MMTNAPSLSPACSWCRRCASRRTDKSNRGLAMNMRVGLLGIALAALATAPASAAVFKWANDGDVRALDPYTFNETVQNSFLENIYERLVQHGKDLSLQPALAVGWETTS